MRIGRFFWRVLKVGPPTRSRGRATALLRCALHGIHLSLRGQSIGRLGSEREIVAPVAPMTKRNRTRSAPTDSFCHQRSPPLTNSLHERSDTNLCSDFSGSMAAVTFSTASRSGTSSRLLSRLRCTRIGRLKPGVDYPRCKHPHKCGRILHRSKQIYRNSSCSPLPLRHGHTAVTPSLRARA